MRSQSTHSDSLSGLILHLFERVKLLAQHVQPADARTEQALALAITARDPATGQHAERVQVLALMMGRLAGLGHAQLRDLATASRLHDVGKLAIPELILGKPGQLNQTELEIMRTHVTAGVEILRKSGFRPEITDVVRGHHERWDGGGYPDGLRADQIPFPARLLAVADCFDALCSHRQYRPAMSGAEAFSVIQQSSGKAFDPVAVALLRSCYHRVRPQQSHPAYAQGPSPGADAAISEAHLQAFGAWAAALSQSVPHDLAALWTNEGDLVLCRCAVGAAAGDLLNKTIQMGEGISGWVARSKRELINADARLEGRTALLAGFRSVLALPIGELGVISLYSTGDQVFRPEHVEALQSLCSSLRQFAELTELDLSDSGSPRVPSPS
ncbi:MAG TPA: HD domain-containing phosphohydrolase [Bryobacteraceae bacterium]|nr:HD domain-containing phosphohydrolase [Bryobacteraceae bacterium]